MRKLWVPAVASVALALTVAVATACGGSGTQGARGVAQGSSGDYCVVLKEAMLRFADLMPGVIKGDSAALDEYVATIDKVRGVAPNEVRGFFDAAYTYYTQEDDSLPPDLLSENLIAQAVQHCGKDFWNFMS